MPDLFLNLERGVSGDMFVAALLDAGADEKELQRVLDSLQLPGFKAEIQRVQKCALSMLDFKVELDADNHDHDMAYLFGHQHEHAHPQPQQQDFLVIKSSADHGEEREPLRLHHHAVSPDLISANDPFMLGHKHDQAHHHDHAHHDHHVHRGLNDILPLIERSAASPEAKALASRIFRIIAAAEAEAHGIAVEEVHFHEVGALDSIVDILSAAVCFTSLHINRVYATPLAEGHGSVNCQHGLLPIPVPAVCSIAAAYHLPLNAIDVEGELVTPTGAAIIAALEPDFTPPQNWQIIKSGYGAGKRAYSRPSFVRALLINPAAVPADASVVKGSADGEQIIKIECNIDDCSGEILGLLSDKLRSLPGVRDVAVLPLFMKKQRPAYLLTIIADRAALEPSAQLIFTESTAIGMRWLPVERLICAREQISVQTSLGPVLVKKCVLPQSLGGRVCYYPEFAAMQELASKLSLPVKDVDALIRGELTVMACRENISQFDA